MDFPQKIKNRTTIQFSNSMSGYLSKENENTNLKTYASVFIPALFTVAKIWKQLKCSLVDEWIRKMYIYIYTHIYIYIIYHKIKNKILLFVTTWMVLEGIMISEISQRKKNTILFHLYVESKKQMSEHNKT